MALSKASLSIMALLLLLSEQAMAGFSNQKRRGEAFQERFIPKVTTSPFKHETSQVTIPFHTNGVTIRRPPSGPNPEGNFEVNAATQDPATRGFKVERLGGTGIIEEN